MKNQLFAMALAVRQHSYSPYSHAQVGAAVRFTSGDIFTGVNIENASYGATVCAERVAIWKGLSEKGLQKITEIAVVTTEAWPPCGLCRQVIAEFAEPETLIHICDLKGIKSSYRFAELMPAAFTPAHLNK